MLNVFNMKVARREDVGLMVVVLVLGFFVLIGAVLTTNWVGEKLSPEAYAAHLKERGR